MRVVDKAVHEGLQEEYLKYAGYVLQQRAIPDVRDCLKDGARKILWSMYKNKQMYNNKAVKGTIATSGVMHYSVHGDASIYGTIVRMAQPFALRYPMVFSDSNYGTVVEGSDFAAGRYLECKLNKPATLMLQDIDKNTVDMKLNYDETKEMPTVLPAFFPNICNGAVGIGVGASTSIPSTNLNDVCNALVTILTRDDYTFEDIYCPIDFPTGATIINENEVKESLKNGNGKAAKVRAKISYDSIKNELVVEEVPYQVYTNTIAAQLTEKVNDGTITQVENFFDATSFDGVSIRIKLIKKANINLAMRELYAYTSLENHFSINMNMLENGRKPRLYGWQEILETYLVHLHETIIRANEFDLKEVRHQLEVNRGYIKALEDIKRIVELIMNSKDINEAKTILQANYAFTDVQVKAILDIKLQKLTKLEAVAINNKIAALEEQEKKHIALIEDKQVRVEFLVAHFNQLKAAYGDARKTINININDEVIEMEEKNIIIHISNDNSIYINEATNYTTQARGGVGSKIKWHNKNNFIKKTITLTTTGQLMLFTNKGNGFLVSIKDLPFDTEVYLQSVVEIEDSENIIDITQFSKEGDLLFATKKGFVKKSAAKEYNITRKGGFIAIKLKSGDELIAVTPIKANDNILLITKQGRSVYFNENVVSSTGRATCGVVGVKLKSKDELVVCLRNSNSKEIFTITTNGYGKRTSMEEYIVGNRGLVGTLCHKLEEEDYIADAFFNGGNEDFVTYTADKFIKLNLKTINKLGKTAKGVKVMDIKNLKVKGAKKIEN